MKKVLALMAANLLVCVYAAAQTGGYGTPNQAASSEQITNGPVAEYISDSSCTIGWATRTPGTMSLRYGTDRNKMNETAMARENADGKNHHAQLSGLKANTRYYFQVERNGQPVGGVGTFQTVETGEPPVRSKAVIPQ